MMLNLLHWKVVRTKQNVNSMASGGWLLDVGSPHNYLFLSQYFSKVFSDLLHQDGLGGYLKRRFLGHSLNLLSHILWEWSLETCICLVVSMCGEVGRPWHIWELPKASQGSTFKGLCEPWVRCPKEDTYLWIGKHPLFRILHSFACSQREAFPLCIMGFGMWKWEEIGKGAVL